VPLPGWFRQGNHPGQRQRGGLQRPRQEPLVTDINPPPHTYTERDHPGYTHYYHPVIPCDWERGEDHLKLLLRHASLKCFFFSSLFFLSSFSATSSQPLLFNWHSTSPSKRPLADPTFVQKRLRNCGEANGIPPTFQLLLSFLLSFLHPTTHSRMAGRDMPKDGKSFGKMRARPLDSLDISG